MGKKRTVFVLAGLAFAVVTWFLLRGVAGLSARAAWCGAVTALCASWWVTEPIPIPATSLIPFATFPLTGVLGHTEVATSYGHSLVLLLLGGFMLSTAMEKSGAHRRLALGMVRLVGGVGGRRLVLGFMVASAALSMWISNTATTLMLLPVALAVLEQHDDERLAVPLLLGMAYASSVGGIGTPVGTPPNVIFLGVYEQETGRQMSFLSWMGIGVPVVLVMVPLVWLWLTRGMGRASGALDLPAAGPWQKAEARVLLVFGVTALAWVTRSEPFGGWSRLIGASGTGDATVALAAVVAMFLLPDGEGASLLDWDTARKIPWGLLLLFGGGIAIARAFGESGLSAALGHALSGLATWPLFWMLLVLCLCVTFLTEVTSNTATTSLLMPILAAAAAAAKVDPRLLMIPAAISASCAFMLPVATAPNAIVFGTERFPTRRMATEGLVLNLIGAVVVTLLCFLLLPR